MVVHDLKDYWTLVQSHRKGDTTAIGLLKLLATGDTKASLLAQQYLLRVAA